MKRHLKRALELALVPFAAAVIFFEQTLIRYLNVAMAALARWRPVALFEAWLFTLPPKAALLAFLAPSILILPVKLAAVWFVAKGKFALALGALIAGKLLATALLARLYRILRPKLMTLKWFAWADTHFFYWRDKAYAFVKSLPAWQKAAEMARRTRLWMADLVSAVFSR